MERSRTGLPDVDALVEVQEVEQRKLDDTIVAGRAESTVVAVRLAELAEQQKAARRRWSAAEGLLTKARKDGAAAAIAAARERCEQACTEFDQVSDAVLAETLRINRARLDHLDEVFDQMHQTWDAGSAVIGALAAPRPQTPPGEHR